MKNPSVKSLARELGVTSRALIDRCRAEGIWVQNSITKLTPSQAEMVRSWFRTEQNGAPDPQRPESPLEL